jgi:uncharacterized protein GlcG (DUF336 family)
MTSDNLLRIQSISYNLAQKGLEAAIKHAQDVLRVPVNISIYSPALRLIAFASMDDAKLTSIDIAHNKAFTAAGHRLPTSAYDPKKVGPNGPLYGIQNSNDGRFTTIAGGVPIMIDGHCVGAIGVSGGLPSQDEVSLRIGNAFLIELTGQEIANKGVSTILAALQPRAKL